MTLRWISASLADGHVLGDLPGLEPSYPLRRTIKASDTATAVLNLTTSTSPDWPNLIQEGGALLVCYDDRDPSYPILWAGYVVEATLGATNEVQLSLATFEAVLDRAYVTDVTYDTSWHCQDIVADLLTTYFTPGTGITVTQTYTAGEGTTPVESIIMQNTDNATVLQRMTEVCGQLGGEFTVEWEWSSDRTSVIPNVVHGTRIGQVVVAGMEPLVSFDMPGAITSFEIVKSYSPDKSGNKVVAYSQNSTASTPYTAPLYWPDDGRPTLEFRYQPAPSISPGKVRQYARQAVKILGPGAVSIAVTVDATRDDTRRLGVDWGLGDDLGLHIRSNYINEQGVVVNNLSLPNGYDAVARVIAYEFDQASVTPMLADKAIYVQDGS